MEKHFDTLQVHAGKNPTLQQVRGRFRCIKQRHMHSKVQSMALTYLD